MPDSAIARQLELLMLGCGFNFYRLENQLRADDLLVRQKAESSLGQAAARLGKLAVEFQAACIPPSTREHPFPPAELMSRLQVLRAAHQRITDQESLLRGLPAPAQDKIWQRFRGEAQLLESLLAADVAMLQSAAEIEKQAQTLTAEVWKSAGGGGGLNSALEKWDAAIRARQDLLQVQAYR
jgi:hypothetical protein